MIDNAAGEAGMARPIVMDVDTGTDDALAILYALRHPELTLLGLTCVAGNVGVDQAVINTCKVLDAASAEEIPVARGAAQPLVERSRRQHSSHGSDGLAGVRLPETQRRPSPLHAVDLLHQLIMDSSQPVSLVTLAPKTNVALLLREHPEVAARIEQIIFMGGAVDRRTAEFNVWQDPEAAAHVIDSPIPSLTYGLDMFERLVIEQPCINRFRTHDHPAIRLAGELLDRRTGHSEPEHNEVGENNVGLLGDAGALVLMTNPELFVIDELLVRIELEGANRGQAVVGREPTVNEWPRVSVAVDLDVTKAAWAFVETINGYAA